MINLRIVSPASLTDRVVAELTASPAVAHVALERGISIQPPGDVIRADVAREAASPTIDRLIELGVDRAGAIMATELAIAHSARVERAERAAPGLGADAVVWEQVDEQIGEETRLSVSFLVFISIATMIAGFGVLLDQPILIVGAMVVGPEFGPLAALSLALVRRDWRIVGRSLAALAVGFGVAGVVTAAATLGFDALGLVDRDMLTGDRPFTSFIWRPDALSWVIAFLAGVAGILSLTTAKSGALIGVLISVTTVPAAANAAVALAYGVVDEASGSLLQLGVNLTAIVVAGVLTLGIQRLATARLARRQRRREDLRDARRGAGPGPDPETDGSR